MLLLKGARRIDLWEGKTSDQIISVYSQDVDSFLDRLFSPLRDKPFAVVREVPVETTTPEKG